MSSGSSSGTSIARRGGRIMGVPKKCWCGQKTVELISKSDANPYRRYYRCAFAAEQKLVNDNHVFKWVNEALSNEIEALRFEMSSLQQSVKAITEEKMELEKLVFDRMQLKFEKEIFERIEDELAEEKSSVKKMMICGVFGFMILVGLMKILG